MRNLSRIFFRCDASYSIGTGHVMRCITLAKALQKTGSVCVFLCDSSLESHLNDHIRAQGFDVHDPNFLETQDGVVNWLVVDHYFLDKTYETAARRYADNIMVIDDLANRPHDCDILLDQNLYDDIEGRYKSFVPTSCRMLLGPNYALIRDEFTRWRDMKPDLYETNRVFINFGGTDPHDVTSRALDVLKDIKIDLRFIVVASAKSHHLKRIKDLCADVPHFELHIQPPNLAELMASCAFAIGAGGTTSWERCCLSLPALIITIADNQFELTATLHARNAVKSLGHMENGIAELRTALIDFSADKEKRDNMVKIAHNICDGLGADRVVKHLS